jgi:Grx4 family monothiol glutaredoxin
MTDFSVATAGLEVASSLEEVKTLQLKGTKLMLFFWAAWHEPSKAGGQLQESFALLAKKHAATTKFMVVEAEGAPEISGHFSIEVVPTYIALSGMDEVGRIDHVNPPELVKLAMKLSNAATQEPIDPAVEVKKKLDALVNKAPVMLFMKGSPDAPRCGFSRTTCEILKEANIVFGHFDILTDEEVRAELKTYSDWPTYPQLYVGGEFQGGVDIIKEMKAAADEEGGDSLKDQLGVTAIEAELAKAAALRQQSLDERLAALTRQAKVMLFMKGTPETPRCGFSRTITGILGDEGIEYSTFDILGDDEVRQGLKVYSEWPTFPQLYVNGTFIGGLDIIKDMKEDGDGTLKEQLEMCS